MYYSYANVMLCKSNIQERNKLHPVGAKRIKEMGKHIVANLHDIQIGLTPHAFFVRFPFVSNICGHVGHL